TMRSAPRLAGTPSGAAREREGAGVMHVGVELASLNKLEVGPGTFNAELYVSIRCDAEPCAPDLEIANGRITGKEKLVDDKLEKELKIKAELTADVDLAEYPFDSHVLPIEIFDKGDPTGVVYVLDDKTTSVDPDLRLA